MTQEQLEGNKVIAEFVADKIELPHYQFLSLENDFKTGWYRVERMCFHSSWDWLMPVVDKISGITIKNRGFVHFEIVPCGYIKISNLGDTPIRRNISIKGNLINAVFLAIVDFIKWYQNFGK